MGDMTRLVQGKNRDPWTVTVGDMTRLVHGKNRDGQSQWETLLVQG